MLTFLQRQFDKFIAIPLAQRKLRHIRVLDSESSIRYITDNKCSVSRFGDGEFDVLMGKNGNTFHKADSRLAARLKDVLVSEDAPNHCIGIPYPLKDTSRQRKSSRDFWGFYTLQNVNILKKYLKKDKRYLDTQLSRFYIAYQNKKNKVNEIEYARSAQQLALLKQIWEDKDVVIVEGYQSRTGVGNDLYDNARSIQRILGLSTNAFEKYDEMLEAIVKNVTKDRLILLSYGMCATILAYDLAKLGYWAIDIGHLDIEYEWFRLLATEKNVVVRGKFTNEAGEKGRENISYCNDEKYLSEIICDITK